MFDVWKALRDDGIDIPYKQFRVYVSRLRRRFAQTMVPTSTPVPTAQPEQPVPDVPGASTGPAVTADP